MLGREIEDPHCEYLGEGGVPGVLFACRVMNELLESKCPPEISQNPFAQLQTI